MSLNSDEATNNSNNNDDTGTKILNFKDINKIVNNFSFRNLYYSEKYLIFIFLFIFEIYLYLKINSLSSNIQKLDELTKDHKESIYLLLKTNLNHLYNNCLNLNNESSNITNFVLYDTPKIIMDNN